MIRQGVMAAAVGGLAGGLPFGVVYSLASRLSEAGGRAAAFALLGACVGDSIGLAEAGLANVIRIGVESIRFYTRKRRPAQRARADGLLVSPEPVASRRSRIPRPPSRPGPRSPIRLSRSQPPRRSPIPRPPSRPNRRSPIPRPPSRPDRRSPIRLPRSQPRPRSAIRLVAKTAGPRRKRGKAAAGGDDAMPKMQTARSRNAAVLRVLQDFILIGQFAAIRAAGAHCEPRRFSGGVS